LQHETKLRREAEETLSQTKREFEDKMMQNRDIQRQTQANLDEMQQELNKVLVKHPEQQQAWEAERAESKTPPPPQVNQPPQINGSQPQSTLEPPISQNTQSEEQQNENKDQMRKDYITELESIKQLIQDNKL
jgi:hypothetical protein